MVAMFTVSPVPRISRETRWRFPRILQSVLLFLLLATFAAAGSSQSSKDILARVSATTARRHAVEYAGERTYAIQNTRFHKTATVQVRVSFQPDVGKTFTILDHSGSSKLFEIVQKLLTSEAESSRPANRGQYEIGPDNYDADIRGQEAVEGRTCYVLNLTPKNRSKYLISGTVWVDKDTYGIVRLEGTTSSNVSYWVGSPHIVEHFAPVEGIWLPRRTKSISSTTLLGESELEIHYSDYRVRTPNPSPIPQ
jgi:outer membrane lipoprotein-sorting protein